LAASASDRPNAPYVAAERTALAEMIINDFRVSFFGSNPAYPSFQVYDFNGDGKVNCSAFPQSGGGRWHDLGIDQFVPGTAASVPNRNLFSLTGNFTVTKSHFWRIMTRGEVWDNVFNSVVGQAALDTVLCVDPMDLATETTALNAAGANSGQYATHVMYQRWNYDFNRVMMSRKMW
jgi:hypothetical protein